MAPGQTFEFCCPINFGDELMRPDGTRLKGIIGERINPFLKSIKDTLNITFVYKESPELGRRINLTDSYTGCLGELQRGESDGILQGMDYPVDVVNVSQGFVILDDRVSYLSAFLRPDAVQVADFVTSFATFHWSLYVMIAIYIYMLFLVLRLHRTIMVSIIKLRAEIPSAHRTGSATEITRLANTKEMIRRYKKEHTVSLLSVVRHFLGTNDIDDRSFFMDLMTLLISCFSFFIFTYYNSLFNTELVSSAPARIHENYRELIEHDVKPLFYEATIYSEQFKYADDGTSERKLWDWAVAKYGEENLYVSRNFSQLSSIMPEGIKGNVALFTGTTLTRAFKAFFCRIVSRSWERMVAILSTYSHVDETVAKHDDWQIYTRISESSKSTIKNLVVGEKFLKNRKLYPVIKRFLTRFFEMGLIHAELESFDRMDILNSPAIENLIGGQVPERLEMKYRCVENNALVPKLPEIDSVMPKYFLISSKVLATVLLIAFFCLKVEQFHHATYSRRRIRLSTVRIVRP